MRIRSVFNSRFLKIIEKNQFLKTFWMKVSNKSLYRAEINFDKYHEAATGLRGYVEAIFYVNRPIVKLKSPSLKILMKLCLQNSEDL